MSQREHINRRSQIWRERSGRSRLRRPGRRRQRRPSARRRPRAASRDPSRLPRSLRGGRVPGGKTWRCSRRAHEAVGKVSSRWRPTAAKRRDERVAVPTNSDSYARRHRQKRTTACHDRRSAGSRCVGARRMRLVAAYARSINSTLYRSGSLTNARREPPSRTRYGSRSGSIPCSFKRASVSSRSSTASAIWP